MYMFSFKGQPTLYEDTRVKTDIATKQNIGNIKPGTLAKERPAIVDQVFCSGILYSSFAAIHLNETIPYIR